MAHNICTECRARERGSRYPTRRLALAVGNIQRKESLSSRLEVLVSRTTVLGSLTLGRSEDNELTSGWVPLNAVASRITRAAWNSRRRKKKKKPERSCRYMREVASIVRHIASVHYSFSAQTRVPRSTRKIIIESWQKFSPLVSWPIWPRIMG